MLRPPKFCARQRFKSKRLDRWMDARSRFNRLSIRNTNHPLLCHWGRDLDRVFWWRISRLPHNSPRRLRVLYRKFPDVFDDPALAAPSNQGKMMTTQTVPSTSDERTVNNVMRHAYRVLSDEEKAAMQKIKDDGLALHDFLSSLGSSRELALAKTKIEEAVMWAVKHITA